MRAHDHAGRAEAALQAVHHAETFLQRRQRAVGVGDAFDGGDVAALGLHREHGAGLHRHAVDIDGAGAAMGGLAADMGAGEREVLADEMHQERARLDEAFDLGAVDLHGHMSFCHLPLPYFARLAARCSARVTMMPPTCLRYSTGPRASAAGDMIASAAWAAFFSEAASRLVPITAFAASAASSGVSCRLVRPIEQVATLPLAHGQHDGGRGGGVVADLALQFFVGVAVAGGRHGDRSSRSGFRRARAR